MWDVHMCCSIITKDNIQILFVDHLTMTSNYSVNREHIHCTAIFEYVFSIWISSCRHIRTQSNCSVSSIDITDTMVSRLLSVFGPKAIRQINMLNKLRLVIRVNNTNCIWQWIKNRTCDRNDETSEFIIEYYIGNFWTIKKDNHRKMIRWIIHEKCRIGMNLSRCLFTMIEKTCRLSDKIEKVVGICYSHEDENWLWQHIWLVILWFFILILSVC
jgi:hypothetical protein